MLTSKQRARLRGMANTIETIFQIGKSGINDSLIKSIDEALEARELIKCRLLETAPVDVRECAHDIAAQVGADVVQVIGMRFVLYRKSQDNPQIDIGK